MRKFRWDVLVFVLGMIAYAFMGRFLTFHNLPPQDFVATVEAQESERFQVYAKYTYGSTGLVSICDKVMGNLVYLTAYHNNSLAVVPNGCPKNPTK